MVVFVSAAWQILCFALTVGDHFAILSSNEWRQMVSRMERGQVSSNGGYLCLRTMTMGILPTPQLLQTLVGLDSLLIPQLLQLPLQILGNAQVVDPILAVEGKSVNGMVGSV